jgi:hypothetical protein
MLHTFIHISFRLQLRKQNHVADAFLAEERQAPADNPKIGRLNKLAGEMLQVNPATPDKMGVTVQQ